MDATQGWPAMRQAFSYRQTPAFDKARKSREEGTGGCRPLDTGDLRSEARHDEAFRLTRPGVIEQPEADRLKTTPGKRAKGEVGSSRLVERPTRLGRIAVNK